MKRPAACARTQVGPESAENRGVVALRCARLLQRLREGGLDVDRAGTGPVVEVYPAGALARWGLPSRGYKRDEDRPRREVLEQVRRHTPWLTFADEAFEHMEASHDALDAMVSALVARAAAAGLTDAVPDEHRERATREGWIHLPRVGSLGALLEHG